MTHWDWPEWDEEDSNQKPRIGQLYGPRVIWDNKNYGTIVINKYKRGDILYCELQEDYDYQI